MIRTGVSRYGTVRYDTRPRSGVLMEGGTGMICIIAGTEPGDAVVNKACT